MDVINFILKMYTIAGTILLTIILILMVKGALRGKIHYQRILNKHDEEIKKAAKRIANQHVALHGGNANDVYKYYRDKYYEFYWRNVEALNDYYNDTSRAQIKTLFRDVAEREEEKLTLGKLSLDILVLSVTLANVHNIDHMLQSNIKTNLK